MKSCNDLMPLGGFVLEMNQPLCFQRLHRLIEEVLQSQIDCASLAVNPQIQTSSPLRHWIAPPSS